MVMLNWGKTLVKIYKRVSELSRSIVMRLTEKSIKHVLQHTVANGEQELTRTVDPISQHDNPLEKLHHIQL